MKRAHLFASLKEKIGAGVGALLAVGVLATASAQAMDIRVQPDRARLLEVAGQPSTVVVGNPLYADVLVVGRKLLVQGRNYGKTNVIVLDADGNRLASFDVVVAGRPEEQIAVYRQGVRSSYVCAPDCGQVVDTSDNALVLEDLGKRVQMRESLITGVNK